MKILFLILVSAALSIHVNAQWTKTNLGGSKSITVHKGKVYALTASAGLQVSNDNGDSWSLVNTDSIPFRKDHLVSSGDRLYVATYDPFTANGNIYYSTDQGVTWTTDTVGLPNAYFDPNKKTDIHNIVAYGDGELIATCSGIDAYMHKNISDASWEIIPELASLDPEKYIGSGDTVIAFGSSPTIMMSTDNANTFTSVTATGLPNYFVASGVYWDRGKRMYLGLNAAILDKTQFYYSDDIGSTWDSFNIASFVGLDFTSSRQKITAVFGLDDNVYFALNNDQSNSTGDIFSSTDGGATFTKDTTGLTIDGFATEQVAKFLYNNQRLFSVHTNTDVHYKALEGPSAIAKADELNQHISVFPNPSKGLVHLSSPVINVRVYNLEGALIFQHLSGENAIDLSQQAPGVYILEYLGLDGFTERQKLILN